MYVLAAISYCNSIIFKMFYSFDCSLLFSNPMEAISEKCWTQGQETDPHIVQCVCACV